jgi:hypothetical protein
MSGIISEGIFTLRNNSGRDIYNPENMSGLWNNSGRNIYNQ